MFKQLKAEQAKILTVDMAAAPYVDWDGLAALEKGCAMCEAQVAIVNAVPAVTAKIEKFAGLKDKLTISLSPSFTVGSTQGAAAAHFATDVVPSTAGQVTASTA
jgi:anti-anti-sigma regulatory factor